MTRPATPRPSLYGRQSTPRLPIPAPAAPLTTRRRSTPVVAGTCPQPVHQLATPPPTAAPSDRLRTPPREPRPAWAPATGPVVRPRHSRAAGTLAAPGLARRTTPAAAPGLARRTTPAAAPVLVQAGYPPPTPARARRACRHPWRPCPSAACRQAEPCPAVDSVARRWVVARTAARPCLAVLVSVARARLLRSVSADSARPLLLPHRWVQPLLPEAEFRLPLQPRRLPA